MRLSAIESLGKLGEKAQAATILLEIVHSTEHHGMHQSAVEALAKLGEKSQIVIQRLLDIARNNTDDDVRLGAVQALRILALEYPLIPKTTRIESQTPVI